MTNHPNIIAFERRSKQSRKQKLKCLFGFHIFKRQKKCLPENFLLLLPTSKTIFPLYWDRSENQPTDSYVCKHCGNKK